METRASEVERQTTSSPPPGPNNRDRCLPPGLGCGNRRSEHGEFVVRGGAPEPYQSPGTAEGSFGSADIHQGQECVTCTSTNGQQDGCVLHQSPERDQVTRDVAHCLPTVGMVSQQWTDLLGRVPPREGEHYSGPRFVDVSDIGRMDAGQFCVSQSDVHLRPIRVDLFALRLNSQLPHYISWHPDPYSVATDAFLVNSKNLQGYAFPPFSLIGRSLKKIRQEGSTVVLIAPVWPSQPWYPWLLKMTFEIPALLPIHTGLLKDPFNRNHPLLVKKQLQLAAWKVSGNPALCQEFRTGLRLSSQLGGERGQTQHTNQDGPSGLAGVAQGISIPFRVVSIFSWTS